MIKKIKVYSHSRNMNLGTADSFGLGVKNDNKIDELYFEFDKMIEGQASLLTSLKDDNEEYIAFPLTQEEDGYSIVVTNQMLTTTGFDIQLQITNDDVVWHSNIYKLNIKPCLEAGTGEMPSAIEVWLTTADSKLYELEQAIESVSNIDIDESKEGNTSTVTITRKDGSTKSIEIVDAMPGPKGDKGDKGDPGAIKMQIVNSLPTTGEEDTIYLVPNEGETGNNYDEYIYVNNQWEKLGGIQVEVDLTDYVKNTDYATTNKGGVIKASNYYGLIVNNDGTPNPIIKTYSDYGNATNSMFISKGTLENVITGKGLTTKSYVDGLVGDIGTALDQINGESVGN